MRLAKACAFLLATAPAAHAADTLNPVVVELFQSQGCSSCPPANANLLAIANRPDVLALSWEVTYWDYLGWTDTFGDRSFTARQWDYAAGLRHTEVYTPQVVVNGRTDIVGDSAAELQSTIARTDRGPNRPVLTLTSAEIRINAALAQGEIFLVRYDPALVEIPILRGENSGRTLPHQNVVVEFRRLGTFTGAPLTLPLPKPSRPGLKTAILLQKGRGGPIIAATHS
jgi:hypothetical protein